jgi:hypothetical protein
VGHCCADIFKSLKSNKASSFSPEWFVAALFQNGCLVFRSPVKIDYVQSLRAQWCQHHSRHGRKFINSPNKTRPVEWYSIVADPQRTPSVSPLHWCITSSRMRLLRVLHSNGCTRHVSWYLLCDFVLALFGKRLIFTELSLSKGSICHDIVMISAGLGSKNDCSGEGQQQL